MTEAELTEYEKSVLSDLDWILSCLKGAVLDMTDVKIRDRLMSYIDAAMSRENMRDLSIMRKYAGSIKSIVKNTKIRGEIADWSEDLWEILRDAFKESKKISGHKK